MLQHNLLSSIIFQPELTTENVYHHCAAAAAAERLNDFESVHDADPVHTGGVVAPEEECHLDEFVSVQAQLFVNVGAVICLDEFVVVEEVAVEVAGDLGVRLTVLPTSSST